jgi:hypothetical protein
VHEPILRIHRKARLRRNHKNTLKIRVHCKGWTEWRSTKKACLRSVNAGWEPNRGCMEISLFLTFRFFTRLEWFTSLCWYNVVFYNLKRKWWAHSATGRVSLTRTAKRGATWAMITWLEKGWRYILWL